MPAEPDARPPPVLAIGCFDGSGATDLVRDFLAARALRWPATLVPTAWMVEGNEGAFRIDVRPGDKLREDVEAALARAGAVKIGRLGSLDLVAPLAQALERFRGPVVYDPVVTAPGGGLLIDGSLGGLQPLVAHASLLTPNLAEATRLTGVAVNDLESARLAASLLRAMGAGAALVKGIPLPGESVDLLMQDEGAAHFSAPRRDSPLPPGSGSALATAIAVGLARGLSVRGATREAHRWLHDRIAAADQAGGADWL